MPKYDYTCEEGHTFELVAGYDDEVLPCKYWIPWRWKKQESHPCEKPARRHAVYRSQGVIFKGEGFTKSVVAPPPPLPKTTQGLTSDQAVEVWDDMAKETYRYDTQDRPYFYEEEAAFAKKEGLNAEAAAEAAAKGKGISTETKEKATKARKKRDDRLAGGTG